MPPVPQDVRNVLRLDPADRQHRRVTLTRNLPKRRESDTGFAGLAAGFQQVAEDHITGARILDRPVNRAAQQRAIRQANARADWPLRFRKVQVRPELGGDFRESVDRDLQRISYRGDNPADDFRNFTRGRLLLADLHDVGSAPDRSQADLSDVAPGARSVEDHDEPRNLHSCY
jgi:hypothetical protein